MKRILTFTFFLAATLVQAQEVPSEPRNGFAFPIGSKFVIKLIPRDSVNFDLSVIFYEPFRVVVDTWNHDELFEEEGDENTIAFYFCYGTHGETEQEKTENSQVLLLMKNYSKEALSYTSDIQRQLEGEFESTSNIGIFPNVKGMEMWPYMIYTIGLKNFKKYEFQEQNPDEDTDADSESEPEPESESESK